MSKAEDKSEYAERQAVSSEIFKFVLNNTVITRNQLDKWSLEDLEWALDAVHNAPVVGEERYKCEGDSMYEYFRAKDLINEISQLKPVRKKLTFF